VHFLAQNSIKFHRIWSNFLSFTSPLRLRRNLPSSFASPQPQPHWSHSHSRAAAPPLPCRSRCPSSPTRGTSHSHMGFCWNVGVIGVKWRVFEWNCWIVYFFMKLLWLNWNYEMWFKCGVKIVRLDFDFEVCFWNWNCWVRF
jgi:hypothetical protein